MIDRDVKLGAEEKAKHAVPKDHIALEVRAIFEKKLKKAGLAEGDVIVGYDGKTAPLGAPSFHDYVRVHHFKPGAVLKLEVIRKGKRQAVELKF